MKLKIIVNVFALLFFYNYVSAQGIYIVAYNGNVKFNDGRVLKNNFRYLVISNNTLTFQEGASAVVFTKDKYFIIEKMSITTPYNYTQLVNKLNTTPAQKKDNGFMAYLKKTYVFLGEIKEYSSGTSVAGIKGFGDNIRYVKDPNETIFPQDSVRALSASIKLQWEITGTTYGSKLIVVNTTLNDTVYNKPVSGKGVMDITVEKEGTYNWFLYSKLENKKSIERVIIKPSPAETARLKSELDDFKKQIASFSEDLQILLLDDYLYQNHISE